jgi:hypothetical protein
MTSVVLSLNQRKRQAAKLEKKQKKRLKNRKKRQQRRKKKWEKKQEDERLHTLWRQDQHSRGREMWCATHWSDIEDYDLDSVGWLQEHSFLDQDHAYNIRTYEYNVDTLERQCYLQLSTLDMKRFRKEGFHRIMLRIF